MRPFVLIACLPYVPLPLYQLGIVALLVTLLTTVHEAQWNLCDTGFSSYQHDNSLASHSSQMTM